MVPASSGCLNARSYNDAINRRLNGPLDSELIVHMVDDDLDQNLLAIILHDDIIMNGGGDDNK